MSLTVIFSPSQVKSRRSTGVTDSVTDGPKIAAKAPAKFSRGVPAITPAGFTITTPT